MHSAPGDRAVSLTQEQACHEARLCGTRHVDGPRSGCRILRVPAEHMLRALERERSWLNYIHTQTGKT